MDPSGAAIAGARVTLDARDGTVRLLATAGADGSYRFEDLAAGQYVVRAQAGGFDASAAKAVDVGRGVTVEIELGLAVAALRTQVVVTASGTPQTTDEVSKALTVVDAGAMNERGEMTLTDALREVPGIRVERLGGPGALSSIRVRGLRTQDTAVLLDGFRLRDAAAPQGDASGFVSDLLLTDTDRIEILRGAGSSLYGTDATGGVVNIVTADGGGRTRGSLLVEGGSLDMFRGRAVVSGAAGSRFQYSAAVAHIDVLSGIDGDDPARTSNAQGRVDYRFSPKARLYGRVYATDSFTKLKVNPQSVGSIPATGIIDAVPLSASELARYESGVPLSQLSPGDATFIPSADNPDNTHAARLYSGAVGLTLHPSEAVGVTLTYQGLGTTRRFGDGPAGPGYQPGGSAMTWYDGETHTAAARADWRAGRHQAIDAGYEFESENYGNRSLAPGVNGASTVAVTQRSHSVYVQDQVSFLDRRLQFAGSWRGQWFSLGQPTFAPATGAPYAGLAFAAPPAAQTGDGSAAYTFAKTGTKVRAHAGTGYRAPSLYERFGADFSSFGYSTYGDPRLAPERTVAVDAGFDQMLGTRAKLSGTYFYTWLRDVIVFDFSGAINPTVDPFGRFGGYLNTHGGIARGAEFAAEIAATRQLSLTAAYTYTNAQERVPLVENILRTFVTPEQQYSLTATQRFSARLTVFFSYVGSGAYLAPVFDPLNFASRAYRFSGLRRGEAGTAYRLPLGEFRAIRFTAKVDNLFNQAYFESGFQTPGATATGGLQFEF